MRTLSSAVAAEILKTATRPRTLFELYLNGGTLRYTDHSSDYTFDGQVYYSRGITHSPIKTYMANRVDNTTIEIDNVDRALSAYFASEDFQGRKIVIKKIFLGLTASDDFILQFEGDMDTPKVNEKKITIKCTNKFDRSKSKSPSRRFGLRCNWDFCSTQCGFNSGIKQKGTCDSGTTTTAADASLPARANDYWKGAKFLVLAGTNRGRSRYIDAYDDATKEFAFLGAFPEAIDGTTEYVIECDKARGTCGEMGNISQFDGFDESWVARDRSGLRTRPGGKPIEPSDEVIPIPYGRVLIEGKLIDEYRYTQWDDWLCDRICGFCGGEIDSVEAVYVNGVELDSFTSYAGGTSQSFSFHGETKYYRRTALVRKTLLWDPHDLSHGVPDQAGEAATWAADKQDSSVKAVLRGKLVQAYNADGSADGSPAWSENPIWCCLDFMMNEASRPMPAADIDFSACKTAADLCDTLGYKVGLKIDKQDEEHKIIERFLTACRGYPTYHGGKMGLHVESTASSVHTFDDNPAGNNNIKRGSFSYERKPINDVPNRVIVTYTDSEVREKVALASSTVLKTDTSINYEKNNITFDASGTAYFGQEAVTYTGRTDTLTGCSTRSKDYPAGFPIYQGIQLFPELTAVWNDEDRQAAVKRIIEKKVDGTAIPTFLQAYKIAEFTGRKAVDCNLFADLTGLIDSLKLTAGDRVAVDHDVPGWTSAAFRITEASEDMDEEVPFKLQYYGATIYEENDESAATPLLTTLPVPGSAPPSVTNLTLTTTLQALVALINVSFDRPTGDAAIFWHHADIYWTNDDWTTQNFHRSVKYGDEVPPIRVQNDSAATYKVRAISVSITGEREDASSAPVQSTVPGRQLVDTPDIEDNAATIPARGNATTVGLTNYYQTWHEILSLGITSEGGIIQLDFSCAVSSVDPGGAGGDFQFRFKRDGTTIYTTQALTVFGNTHRFNAAFTLYDSEASAASHTYTVEAYNNANQNVTYGIAVWNQYFRLLELKK
jgi:hypothetical protein